MNNESNTIPESITEIMAKCDDLLDQFEQPFAFEYADMIFRQALLRPIVHGFESRDDLERHIEFMRIEMNRCFDFKLDPPGIRLGSSAANDNDRKRED